MNCSRYIGVYPFKERFNFLFSTTDIISKKLSTKFAFEIGISSYGYDLDISFSPTTITLTPLVTVRKEVPYGILVVWVTFQQLGIHCSVHVISHLEPVRAQANDQKIVLTIQDSQ